MTDSGLLQRQRALTTVTLIRPGYMYAYWVLDSRTGHGGIPTTCLEARARHFCVIEVTFILPFQICDRIFQRVTSDSIKCNSSFVRPLSGRDLPHGGPGGAPRDRS